MLLNLEINQSISTSCLPFQELTSLVAQELANQVLAQLPDVTEVNAQKFQVGVE